jgi:3-hydroxyisobutyrate dehydrogenase-like beta-hydroxyacid dehydrogenase
MEIGFIGLGSMGSRIVDLLVDGGHHLTLWARRPASVEPFAGRARSVDSPKEVGRACDLVGICVWDEQDVEQVLLGEDGVLAGVRPEAVIAIHSTIPPAACRRLEQMAATCGAGLIDAPVSVGSSLPKLLMMVGGAPETVERCRPALESAADPFLHLGPVGSGQIAKLVNNTMLAATIGLGDDAIAFGADLGLDATALAAALAAGSCRGTWSTFVNRPRPEPGDQSASRTTEWARKDVSYALGLAAEASLDRERHILRLARRGVEVVG